MCEGGGGGGGGVRWGNTATRYDHLSTFLKGKTLTTVILSPALLISPLSRFA